MEKSTLKLFTQLIVTSILTSFCFVGSFLYVSAEYTPWTDYVSTTFVGSSTSIIKNNQYWEITLSNVTAGGMYIGLPYSQQQTFKTQTSPWYVTYMVVSNFNCSLRLNSNTSQASVTGSSVISLTASTSATTSTISFTTPYTSSGRTGLILQRDSGTASCVVRFYTITNNLGEVLWSPTMNTESFNNQATFSNATSSGGGTSITFPTTTAITTENDQIFQFATLLMIFGLSIALIIALLRPFYVRK